MKKFILLVIGIFVVNVSLANERDDPLEYQEASIYFLQKKYEKAYFLYKKLADDTGYSPAQYNVGVFNEKNMIENATIERAVKYYTLSANQGNAEAQNNLAILYVHGDRIAQDLKKAHKYFKLAADQGNLRALHSLAHMYYGSFDGDFKTDIKKAITLLELSANAGNAHSYETLSDAYMLGKGVKEDKEKGFDLMKKAADKGLVTAQNTLAIYYLDGIGTEENIKKGEEYLIKASDNGHVMASYNLAYGIVNGFFEGDDKRAVFYYKRSAQAGYPHGQFYYGLNMAGGRGIEKNLERGYMWILLGIQNGYKPKQESLDFFNTLPQELVKTSQRMAEECIKKQYQCD